MDLKTKLITLDITLMLVWVFTASATDSQALNFDNTLNSPNSPEIDPQLLSYDTEPDHFANSCCCGDCAAQLVDQL